MFTVEKTVNELFATQSSPVTVEAEAVIYTSSEIDGDHAVKLIVELVFAATDTPVWVYEYLRVFVA